MAYRPQDFESTWQQRWEDAGVHRAQGDGSRPTYYVLDMFPYPSGSGLHVGHPLGYVASDIVARHKRMQGFDVLHPMGFDAFGLPAEQYAIETGRHPAATTADNIAYYKRQLRQIGLSFDWSREVVTSDPAYYRWTQWLFTRFFHHYYDTAADAARPIADLEAHFAAHGRDGHTAFGDDVPDFTADDWSAMTPRQRSDVLMAFRLAYKRTSTVNWCEALGTVLANDEVVNGVSERGGHPVVQRPMEQWALRITAYAERLLSGLDDLDWSDSLKAQQANWIGRSTGASVRFGCATGEIEVFTTRPDTLFGVTFLVLAPEHPLVDALVTDDRRDEVQAYVDRARSRTAVERQQGQEVTGVDTGATATHPLTGEEVPIWVADYVLADYGTGAIMAVPAGDDRDHAFATAFGLPTVEVIDRPDGEEDRETHDARLMNSDFLDGLPVPDAIERAIAVLEEKGTGQRTIQYKLRDANFSRQRYWGEPFPIAYDADGVPHALDASELPLELPPMDDFQPANGRGPLERLGDAWVDAQGRRLETDTMPGNAGSSWYFLRYMDAHNDEEAFSSQAVETWRDVDLYVGGTEHAVGHLMYARFWHKFLHDQGLVPTNEPFKKLVNQGMIQGVSAFVGKVRGEDVLVSAGRVDDFTTDPYRIHVTCLVDESTVDIDALIAWRPELADTDFELEDGVLHARREVEKMSKSKFNVVNPDDVIARYGADTLRLFEMFLGPVEDSKPWNTEGISGTHKFLRKLWALCLSDDGTPRVTEEAPSEQALKSLHTCIKKVNEDVDRFAFNTCISALMICVNELTEQTATQRAVLEPLVKLVAPFAPHIAEELWHTALGHDDLVCARTDYPQHDESLLVESTIEYPVSVNGKTRTKLSLPADITADEAQAIVLADATVQKWMDGKDLRKFIFVPGRIVNVVV